MFSVKYIISVYEGNRHSILSVMTLPYSLDQAEFSPGFCALEDVSGPATHGLRLTYMFSQVSIYIKVTIHQINSFFVYM